MLRPGSSTASGSAASSRRLIVAIVLVVVAHVLAPASGAAATGWPEPAPAASAAAAAPMPASAPGPAPLPVAEPAIATASGSGSISNSNSPSGSDADDARPVDDAAIRFEIEFFAGDGTAPVNRAIVHASGRRLRIEQQRPGAAAPVFVYRGDRGRLYSIAETTRTYLQLEPALLARLGGGSTRDARSEVDAGLAALPPDQQRAFGHLLGVDSIAGKDPGSPLVVSRTGGSEIVSGIACERVELRRGGRLLAAGCIAAWRDVGLTPEDVEVFRSLAELVRNAAGSRMPLPIEMVPGQPLDLVVQFGGLPLVFERAGRASGASAIRVASVERVTADDALFEVPSGYAQRPGMAGLAGLTALLSRGRASPPASPASAADPGSASPAALAPWGDAREGGEGGSGSGSVSAPRSVTRRAFETRSSSRRIVYRPIRLFEEAGD